MGFDLQGAKGADVSLNTDGWHTMIRRGLTFHWIPTGTARGRSLEEQAFGISDHRFDIGESNDWGESNRGYWSNDGNVVEASDAANLAIALRSYRATVVRIQQIMRRLRPEQTACIKQEIQRINTAVAVAGNPTDEEMDNWRADALANIVAPIRASHWWLRHMSDSLLAELIRDASDEWIAVVDRVIGICDDGAFAIH